MRWGTKVAALAAVIACMALWPAPAAAAPANDHFADAQELTLPSEVNASNVGATLEAGEYLGPFNSGHSVWFRWEATSTEWVTIDACNGEIDTTLSIFTGTELTALTKEVDGNAHEGPHCWAASSEYSFKAEIGTKYVIAVDSTGYQGDGPPRSTEGSFELRLEKTPRPPNDDYADATVVSGSIDEEPDGSRRYLARSSGYNWTATPDPGEPDPGAAAGTSVWYRWTAPETGLLRLSSCCGSTPFLRMFIGASLENLTTLSLGPLFVQELHVTKGEVYSLAIDSLPDESTEEPLTSYFSLLLTMALPPLPPPPAAPAAAGPDVTPPTTAITSRAVDASRGVAQFRFSASEHGATFRCRLDGHRANRCSSPKKYRNLNPGRHAFQVYAVDGAGNADPTPARARFTIAARRKLGKP
jgi:hypothetical protein